MDLYQRILKSFFSQTNDERLIKIQKVQAEIDKNKTRISKAMQMMLDGEIESFDYKAIKTKYEMVNTTLLIERSSLEIDKVDYSSTINGCFNLLKHLDKFYNEASVSIKQKIVPHHRDSRSVAKPSSLLEAVLKETKNRKACLLKKRTKLWQSPPCAATYIFLITI